MKVLRKFKFNNPTRYTTVHLLDSLSQKESPHIILPQNLQTSNYPYVDTLCRGFRLHPLSRLELSCFAHSAALSTEINADVISTDPDEKSAITVQNIFKYRRDSSTASIERALDLCSLKLTDDLVLKVLKRHHLDWKPAYIFFKWVLKRGYESGYTPESRVYNEMIDILGKMLRFEELNQVLDEVSERKAFDEGTYGTLLNRYAAADKVEEAKDLFFRRGEFGLVPDLAAFQKLLMWLCRYKHVEVAETLFHSRKHDFSPDIKTWNIILNGWCVLGNVYEAKRFWKDIVASKCKPDLFTYGTFITALTKKGKLATALRLFRSMRDKGCKPDVVIYNCVIDALCFKKRIPEALQTFHDMEEYGCPPNVVTYNSLIKHLCKIRRMDKVYELLNEMEQKVSCVPNEITYNYLLKSSRKPEEVTGLLDRMKRKGCKLTSDTYNLILKLYMHWGCMEKVIYVWDEMIREGLGPDQRSYTIMIHGLHHKGRIEESVRYFHEMTSKGMVPEPRTELLVADMKTKMKEEK